MYGAWHMEQHVLTVCNIPLVTAIQWNALNDEISACTSGIFLYPYLASWYMQSFSLMTMLLMVTTDSQFNWFSGRSQHHKVHMSQSIFTLNVANTRPIYSVSQKIPPLKYSDIFPKWLGIFSPNFARLLHVPIYAGLQIVIQLSATLTKLHHIIKRDHHYMLKMSTIDRNACWVVTLKMA